MLERSLVSSAEAATFTTPQTREHPHINFQKTFEAIKEKVSKRSPAVRAIELGQLVNDGSRLFWAGVDLHSKVNNERFMSKEEHLSTKATAIFAPGLGAFRGSEFFKMLPQQSRCAFADTYGDPMVYLDSTGWTVTQVWNGENINKGNIKKSVDSIRDEVKSALRKGPTFLIGHSIGGIEEQIFAALNPELAEKVDGIFLGGSPIPDNVNSWVLNWLLAMQGPNGGMDFEGDVSDFYRTGAYERVNFISIKDRHDPVVEGFAAGEVINTDDGHASVFHQVNNLRRVVHMANQIVERGSIHPVAA